MKIRQFILSLIAIVLWSAPSVAHWEVTANLQGVGLPVNYNVTRVGMLVRNGVPYVQVSAEGDCFVPIRPPCWDDPRYSPGRGPFGRDCYEDRNKVQCTELTSLYPLPKDQFSWDGEKRIKFTGDDQYITVAKRHWYGSTYTTYSNVDIEPNSSYTNVKVRVHPGD